MYYFDPSKSPIQEIRETKAKIRQILERADRNSDGIYTKDELKSAFRELGSFCPLWRTYRCVRHVDADGNGEISGDEIEALVGYIFARVKNGHYRVIIDHNNSIAV